MAFRPEREIVAADVKYALINNSQTLTRGEVIIPAVVGEVPVVSTGGSTTAGLLGIVLSIVGNKGRVLELNTFAAPANNVTVGLVRVAYLPTYIPMEYEGELDANAGVTTGSSAFGNFSVDSTGELLLESSYTAFGTVASKQFFSFGMKEGSVRKNLCRYMRSTVI